jgi:hypothetical protein
MRTKVTLVLLFLNAALFFFIFKFERNWRTERASLEARRRVLGAEAADIRTLTVTSTAAGGSYRLTRNGETWQLTQPLDWPANPTAVSRIVNDLQFLEHETSFAVADLKTNGQSLADYGLDQPKLIVTFTSGDPSLNPKPEIQNPKPLLTTLRLGDTTKIGNRLYLLSPDGKRIHVVSRSLVDSLSVPLAQLRANTLLTIPVFEARSLRVQSSTRVALHRDGLRWTFDTPIVARASKDETDLAIAALDALHPKVFITDNPPVPLPSAAPAYRITIEGNNRRETLILGAALPPSTLNSQLSTSSPQPTTPLPAPSPSIPTGATDFYAQIEGRAALFVVTVPTTLLDVLDKAQVKLREKRVLDFDPRAVTAITLRALNAAGQPTLTLQRLEAPANSVDVAAWQIIRRTAGDAAPQTLPADRVAVQRLLEQLSLLSAEIFVSDAPTAADIENWGFARPEREVTLTLARPAAPGSASQPSTLNSQPPSQIVLQLGLASQRDNYAYARVAGAAFVYAVNSDILRLETPVTPAAWRERTLRELPAGARITALKLTDLTTNRPVFDIALDDAGNLKPGTPQAKPIAVVLAAIRTLRAKSFPQEGFTAKVPLLGADRSWRYRLDATLSLPGATAGDPAPVTTLLLSERIGGMRQLAGSKEFDAVFEIEQPLVDALWSLTYTADPGPALPKTAP